MYQTNPSHCPIAISRALLSAWRLAMGDISEEEVYGMGEQVDGEKVDFNKRVPSLCFTNRQYAQSFRGGDSLSHPIHNSLSLKYVLLLANNVVALVESTVRLLIGLYTPARSHAYRFCKERPTYNLVPDVLWLETSQFQQMSHLIGLEGFNLSSFNSRTSDFSYCLPEVDSDGCFLWWLYLGMKSRDDAG